MEFTPRSRYIDFPMYFIKKSADPLGLARRLMLPLPLSPSPPGPKITLWPLSLELHPPRICIIFQVLFSIAIKTDFEVHLGSILASIGTQKHWFLMGGVSKINIFTFFILNIIWTRFLIDFGLLGASKMVQKSMTRTDAPPKIRILSRSWAQNFILSGIFTTPTALCIASLFYHHFQSL